MEMYYKKNDTFVEVYKFFENKTALIYSYSAAKKNNGNGWDIVKMGQLIPIEYYNKNKDKFLSAKERSELKELLIYTGAVWTCSDGLSFSNFEDAIFHQRIIKKEEEFYVK